jgi:hypothetical protein
MIIPFLSIEIYQEDKQSGIELNSKTICSACVGRNSKTQCLKPSHICVFLSYLAIGLATRDSAAAITARTAGEARTVHRRPTTGDGAHPKAVCGTEHQHGGNGRLETSNAARVRTNARRIGAIRTAARRHRTGTARRQIIWSKKYCLAFSPVNGSGSHIIFLSFQIGFDSPKI